MRAAAATIATKSQLAHARVLARSFAAQHPDVPFFVLLADEAEGVFDPAAEPYRMLPLAGIGVPDVERLRFRYAQEPFVAALAPFLLAHLLGSGSDRVVLLDVESLVLSRLDELFERLSRRAIVLTPHLAAPLRGDDPGRRERAVLLTGVYHAGCIGVAARDTASRFLGFWQDRVAADCRLAVTEGLHHEQRWLDLVPAYFDDVHVLRDAGYGVGHWSLAERRVEADGDTVRVDGATARVFHFSGYEPLHADRVSRFRPDLDPRRLGGAARVFERYHAALVAENQGEIRRWEYAYGRFDNRVPVPDLARRLYDALCAEPGDAVARFGDPLVTAGDESFHAWLCAPAAPGSPVSRLWQAVHRARPDLQHAFPDALGLDAPGFLQWTARHGAKEHGISPRFLAPGLR